jgi:hypothetical protein
MFERVNNEAVTDLLKEEVTATTMGLDYSGTEGDPGNYDDEIEG